MPEGTEWAGWCLVALFIFVVVYIPVMHIRTGICYRVRQALCRGPDYKSYYLHLPEADEMVADPLHWNKWGARGWMKWIDKQRARGKLSEGTKA